MIPDSIIKKFTALCKSHDWSYQRAEVKAYRAGSASADKIDEMLKAYPELIEIYRQHRK